MTESLLLKRTPLLLFIGTYLFTCYIGAVFLLFGPEHFFLWYRYFSGIVMPNISYEQLRNILVLLHIPVILFAAGYELAIRIRIRNRLLTGFHDRKSWFLIALLISEFFSVLSVTKLSTFGHMHFWLDYNSFIHGREQTFQKLGFFEFANIYSLLPTFMAGAFLYIFQSQWKKSIKIFTVSFNLIFLIFINLSILQKKGLVVSILVILFTLYLYYFSGKSPRIYVSNRKKLSIAAICLASIYLIYILLVLAPVVLKTSKSYVPTVTASTKENTGDSNPTKPAQTIKTTITNIMSKPKQTTEAITFDNVKVPNHENRNESLILYTLMAPLNRTSSTSIAFPIVFPHIHPYYRIDVGEDILGFGAMPDDNSVISKFLWPSNTGGATAAPYQFVLFSQGGIWVACIGSILLGMLIGFFWNLLVLSNEVMNSVSALLAGLIMVFSIFLGLDSFRNTVFSSYGILYPFGIVLIISVFNIIQNIIPIFNNNHAKSV